MSGIDRSLSQYRVDFLGTPYSKRTLGERTGYAFHTVCVHVVTVYVLEFADCSRQLHVGSFIFKAFHGKPYLRLCPCQIDEVIAAVGGMQVYDNGFF